MNSPANSAEAVTPDPPGIWRLTRFFVPLAVQAASQSLCYPLVAMVAT
jgi:N-acyl-L-homoserine lactone synthetase